MMPNSTWEQLRAAMPEDLRAVQQWVGWKRAVRNGKETKVPVNPHSGQEAKVNDSATWGDVEKADAAVARFGLAGIGFVFADSDPFSGIDLDDCRNPETGEIAPWAARIIALLDSYAEVSPSHTGVKVWLRGKLPQGARCRTQCDGGEIEVYSRRRFFTFTGLRIPGSPTTVQARQPELEQLHRELFPAIEPANGRKQSDVKPDRSTTPPEPGIEKQHEVHRANTTDAEILESARLAKNGAKFVRLYAHGDTSDYGNDASRADLALCVMLAFWSRKDPIRIDRLFRESRLMRPKWDAVHYADGRTYGRATVERALQMQQEVYSPPEAADFDGDAGEAETEDAEPPVAGEQQGPEEVKGGSNQDHDEPEFAEGPEPADAASKPENVGASNPTAPEGTVAEKRKESSQAALLVKLVNHYAYFHTKDKRGYATFNVGAHFETHPVKSRAFKLHLQHLYYLRRKTAISSKGLNDALGVLEAKALFAGPEHPVYTRVGEADGNIYIDIGDQDWNAIEITPTRWRTVANPPVKFHRSAGMLPLPKPTTATGGLDGLRRLLNIAEEDDFKLVVGWLLSTLRPRGPYPALLFRSEHGSGKSTATRIVRGLIDPNTAAIRAVPKEEQDLLIAASHSWVLAFDNVTKVPAWLSDALCRMSTGGGFGTRELYTTEDEVLFEAQRPVVLNGIVDIATRGDLRDRSICIDLPPISAQNRMAESDFWANFGDWSPAILAALLDGAARACADVGSVDLTDLPRMADFCTWVEAAAPALGWKPKEFHGVYTGNRDQGTAATLESSPVARHLLDLRDWRSETWEGTATALLAELDALGTENEKRQIGWPRNPQGLGNVLRLLAPDLRAAGLSVTFTRRTATRTRDRIIALGAIQPPLPGAAAKPEEDYPD